jgi:hypothetical protein
MGQRTEIWLDIDGTGGAMQVSDLGRVRSRRARNGVPLPEREWRICEQSCHDDGYMKVGVGGKVVLVHDLVLTAFRGPAPAGHVARHLDGNPSDNRIEKLKWGTRSENNQDTARHFRMHNQCLTEDEAWGAKLLLRLGNSVPVVRQFYPSASGRLISAIRCERVWRHLIVPDIPAE